MPPSRTALSSVPEYGLFDRARSPVVQVAGVRLAYLFLELLLDAACNAGGQSDAPERRRSSLRAARISLAEVVGEVSPHVVQQ